MKKITTLFLLLLLPVPSHAQSALAGTDLRLAPQSSAPSNLSGRAGIYNLNGVYVWHNTSNVDGPILECPTCTTNVLPYFDTLSGNTALPSAWFYNSGSSQFSGAGASNPYCVRLDNGGGVADAAP